MAGRDSSMDLMGLLDFGDMMPIDETFMGNYLQQIGGEGGVGGTTRRTACRALLQEVRIRCSGRPMRKSRELTRRLLHFSLLHAAMLYARAVAGSSLPNTPCAQYQSFCRRPAALAWPVLPG